MSTTHDPSWSLRSITELPGVWHALILTADGMVQGASERLTREQAEGIAAMCASLHGASRAVSAAVPRPGADDAGSPGQSGAVETVTVQTSDAIYMMVPAGTNGYLWMVGSPTIQMGVVIQEMVMLANRLGEQLMSVASRTAAGTS